MLSDTQIRSLKIEDGKRHADREGLVLELRPSKKQLKKNLTRIMSVILTNSQAF